MTQIELGVGIIGVVEAIKSVGGVGDKVSGWATLVVALLLGGVAGYFHLLGTPDVLSGIFVGAGAVGTHTVASTLAGK